MKMVLSSTGNHRGHRRLIESGIEGSLEGKMATRQTGVRDHLQRQRNEGSEKQESEETKTF